MKKKIRILGICGSYRAKGSNSEWMLDKVLEGVVETGAEIKKIRLQDYNIKYCKGCDVCRKTGSLKCTINDDMAEIYDLIKDYDGYVISSANYFKNVSGQIKTFMDRTNIFVYLNKEGKTVKYLKGKPVIGLSIGGEGLNDLTHCEGALARYFKAHKFKTVDLIKAKADDKSELEKEKDDYLKNRLKFAGKKLVKKVNY